MESDESDSPTTKPFQCPSCSKSYLNESSLNHHILTKHVKVEKLKSYSCKECFNENQVKTSFETKSSLNAHIKQVHRPNHRFKCQVCFKTFTHLSWLRYHAKTHLQNSQKHPCELCSESCVTKHKLAAHLFRVHGKKTAGMKYLKCECCTLEFLYVSSLERHVVENHVVDKAFECDVCSKKFVDQETLDKHMKGHDQERKHVCDICSNGFTKLGKLKQHLGVIHKKFFYCNKCSRSFSNKSKFDQHSKPDSKVQAELKCKICILSFDSQCNLGIHKKCHLKIITKNSGEADNKVIVKAKTHKNVTDVKIAKAIGPEPEPEPELSKGLNLELQCQLCSKIFDCEVHFAAHRKQMHPNSTWKCNFPQCLKSFMVYSRLRVHTMTHSEKKPFVCHICQKGFYERWNLKKHHSYHHLQEKKNKCERCSKSCVTKADLRIHTANNHGGPKPFKCPIKNCGTSWASNNLLNIHLVSHRTEKIFKCESCTKHTAFKSHQSLNAHMRNVHSSHTRKRHAQNSSRKLKFSDAHLFYCSSNSCSFQTRNEKDIAIHYNEQHQLPQVVIFPSHLKIKREYRFNFSKSFKN